jgi:hypothetical protein
MSAHELLPWVNAGLGLLGLLGTLFVFGKSVVAYRQHGDRSMLLFGGGLVLILVAPVVVAVGWGTVVSPALGEGVHVVPRLLVETTEQLFRLAGVACLVAAMYVRE